MVIQLLNRQLCIANAFEQVLEEKTPLFPSIPASQLRPAMAIPLPNIYIKKKWLMDVIYYLMKPLEWIFVGSLLGRSQA